MTLVQVHDALSRSCILFSLIIAGYGLWQFSRRAGVVPAFWGTLVMAEVLYVAQGVLGVVLYLLGGRPARGVHFLYGILMLICLPAAYAFTRGRDGQRELLMYSLLSLFLAGIAFRAITTALTSLGVL